jgi:predicted AAA+ superfamily ATPase
MTLEMDCKNRCALPLVSEMLGMFPMVAVLGPRQCGKTTLVQSLPGKWSYFDLERGTDFDQISLDPDLFLRLNPSGLVLDEAQLLPELFPALRVAVDALRRSNGRFVITGSSSPELIHQVSESLAGRVAIIELSPFTAREALLDEVSPNPFFAMFEGDDIHDITTLLTPTASLEDIHDYWFRGGYPEPWLNNNERFSDLWFTQYVQTYIDRDISHLFPGLNGQRFRQFIRFLSGLSGEIINYSNTARALGISQPTAREYFNIAHGTFVWRQIPAWDRNVQKRLIKHPKGILRDSGLLHHLLQVRDSQQLLQHPVLGRSWEGFVIEHLLRNLNLRAIGHQYYHYRTKAGGEIDLILEGKFGTIPFEIKYAGRIKETSLRALKRFLDEQDLPLGIVINNGERICWHDERIVSIPFAFTV